MMVTLDSASSASPVVVWPESVTLHAPRSPGDTHETRCGLLAADWLAWPPADARDHENPKRVALCEVCILTGGMLPGPVRIDGGAP